MAELDSDKAKGRDGRETSREHGQGSADEREPRGAPPRELMPILERQVGSLALSELDGVGPMALMRAVAWNNVLARLGIAVPLVIIHDVGCLMCGLGRPASVTQGIGDPRLGEAWRQLLVELGETELVRQPAAWKHRDPMVGVVLARVLASVAPQLPEDARVARPRELPVDVVQYARIDPRSAYTRYDQDLALAWLRTMTSHRLLPLLETEQIDVDALRLLGLFRTGQGGVAGVDLADLYNVILSPQLADVIDFSLELLPSLLEVRREMGQQTFGIDGYASIERIGHIDNMVLTQLAFDDEVFEQKFVDHELFYYTHEKQYENERRIHYVLVDGSASMRGVREVFARGLALALCKRLALLGEEVVLRFFDSRLYDGVKVGAAGHVEVPYVLQFRAERGRNYAAVLRQLNAELSAPRRDAASTLVYMLTHGEAQFPASEVQLLASRAPIYGVFILPRGPLNLGYLDALHRVHVIDDDAIAHGRRASRARQIISEVESDLEDAARSQVSGVAEDSRGRERRPG
ncbi:hypothetical protein ENSA5_49350 [Enhygromyxa salina]|uniref:VWFA domain-containing protein n=1 Tax=Enhygromyxa salina TaxID=215803 RepID=A0A2S9XHW7_9BACT|nr:hypothetical protein [Enhygromyxa salina]PRP92427.1 hypothetical protein ENSA5_49350 [Enhygromyxa salina]